MQPKGVDSVCWIVGVQGGWEHEDIAASAVCMHDSRLQLQQLGAEGRSSGSANALN